MLLKKLGSQNVLTSCSFMGCGSGGVLQAKGKVVSLLRITEYTTLAVSRGQDGSS